MSRATAAMAAMRMALLRKNRSIFARECAILQTAATTLGKARKLRFAVTVEQHWNVVSKCQFEIRKA
jgi:hypothetical protein